ncbi:MAG: RcnB family protein [Alphaproteobacteria bacterium]
MRKYQILTAAALLSLLGSTAAFANHDHWRRDHWNNGRHLGWEKKAHARWVRGHEFPAQYRAPRYVVYDYDRYQLRRPAPGYVWYRADNDYVLVRKKTNLIEEIIEALD